MPDEFDCEFGPARLVAGPGALERAGELARAIGARRVLLVTDPGVRRAGHVEVAVAALERAKVAVVVHDRVAENPTGRHVAEAAEAARNAGADAFVAVGGGSVMDCAKGANFVLTNGGRIQDYRGSGQASRPMLPSLAAPATTGTGSEAQSYALITDEESGAKMACGDKKAMFRAVILDPRLAATVPRAVRAAAGLDAVSHAVESYVTRRRNPLSQIYAREAWRLLDADLEAALAGSADLDVHGRLLLGSFLAGAAIEQSMLGAAHASANPLTARYPIAHGAAVALMLPHVVRYNAPEVGPLYADLGPRLEERIRELRRSAGLPETLRDCAVPAGALPTLARDAAGQWTAEFNPRAVTPEDFLELYEAAY